MAIIKNISTVTILKPGLTNANSNEGTGNDIPLKLFNVGIGIRSYISGQMMRHALREALIRADPSYVKEGCDVGKQCGDPLTCKACDMFGYMVVERKKVAPRPKKAKKAKSEETEATVVEAEAVVEEAVADGGEKTEAVNMKRTGPLKVSPAIALMGNGITDDFMVQLPKEGNPVPINQKLVYDLYKWGISIDIDGGNTRANGIGTGDGFDKGLEAAERGERAAVILNSLCNLYDVSKQSRLMCDLTPKLVILSINSVCTNQLQEALDVDTEMNVNVPKLESVLKDMAPIAKFYAGITDGVFANEAEVKTVLSKYCAAVDTPRAICTKVASLVSTGV